MVETTYGKGYGKILLVGGYSVLEKPNKALVLSVENAYIEVKAKNSDRWLINSEYGYWEGNDLNKIPESLKFVKHAILESDASNSYALEIKSSELLSSKRKIGLGSSAAVTHAVVEALSPRENKNEIFLKAYRAHCKAQGKIGSGFDVASSVFGTIIYERPSGLDTKDYKIENVSISDDFHISLYNIVNSGTNTVVSVKKVLEKVEKDPVTKKYFEELAELNNSAINYFKKERLNEFMEILREINDYRKKLGNRCKVPIEPKELDKIREEIEKEGYVTILPGAGGYDSLAVISLEPIKGFNHPLLEEVNISLRKE